VPRFGMGVYHVGLVAALDAAANSPDWFRERERIPYREPAPLSKWITMDPILKLVLMEAPLIALLLVSKMMGW